MWECGIMFVYAYCGNNPAMNVDPSGHMPFLTIMFIAIGISTLLTSVANSVVNVYWRGENNDKQVA